MKTIDPKMVRLSRDDRRFFDILVQRQEIESPTLASHVRELATRFPRLIATEKSTTPGVYFWASLTDEGRAVLNHEREVSRRRVERSTAAKAVAQACRQHGRTAQLSAA